MKLCSLLRDVWSTVKRLEIFFLISRVVKSFSSGSVCVINLYSFFCDVVLLIFNEINRYQSAPLNHLKKNHLKAYFQWSGKRALPKTGKQSKHFENNFDVCFRQKKIPWEFKSVCLFKVITAQTKRNLVCLSKHLTHTYNVFIPFCLNPLNL